MIKEKEAIAEDIYEGYKKEILEDYRLVCLSREASLLGRREVLMGKAKFGIFGDGKELAQVAMAKQFQNGDFRSGYYRDQTFMFAIDQLTIREYFASLYANPNLEKEPQTGGRQMNGHFATRSLNPDGSWKNLMEQKNSSSDISPTASQMPRLLGLALASKKYRNIEALHDRTTFSNKGNEVAFGTIGDASTSEGHFWETMNAAGVLQVPMVVTVYDDGYGISVPKKYQTTKESISTLFQGWQRDKDTAGIEVLKTKGWNYPDLIKTYEKAVKIAREEQVPVLIHIEEVTQPQGHSTSGSHERYKSKERLEWMKEFECVNQFRKWILEKGDIASAEDLDSIQKEAKKFVREEQKAAWKEFEGVIMEEVKEAIQLIVDLATEANNEGIKNIAAVLNKAIDPSRKDVFSALKRALRNVRGQNYAAKQVIIDKLNEWKLINEDRYNSHLYSESELSALKVQEVPVEYGSEEEMVDGRIILRENYIKLLEKYPEALVYGEDVGKIGGVNQTLEGVQAIFGEDRVSDTGIREATIIGQGIGMAMRGLRPIAEIQYLDYVLYAIQLMSDDISTLQYRTKGGQKAPMIISTRGHRLEGIWHSGSPMAGIINLVRGMHVCVPRNMTQAAGFYNTIMASDEPAIVVEALNGYRSKERMPSNIGEFRIPLGVPEIVKEGKDITVVSYGSTFNVVNAAADQLAELGVDIELIDVRTLLPFDIHGIIAESIKKTNRVIFIDEDVPGGATAFMLDQVLNNQKAYFHLDSEPKTITAKAHRPAYGSDGDYFSKPSMEDIVDGIYEVMHEADPAKYPSIY
jgi:pyruvate/2-oxoglutarate/acetoin dehydrogenase E1 component/TPP-dependent pyruvate/acetoin dehydrogenase alpha subunit